MVKCFVCDKEVFSAEEVKAAQKVFHEGCFKCATCKTQLAPGGILEMEGKVYCSTCHKKQFGGPKGASYDTSSDKSSLDSDVKGKIEAKYDKGNEEKVRAFIEKHTGEKLGDNLQESLKDGIILCNLLNKLRPGLITGHKKGAAFVQMENINKFLIGLQALGFKATETFMTVDLFEGKNMVVVMDTLLQLQRKTG
eukprot:TRINITY_DN208_c0_g1_i11.p1 TRINITY_DN208_c0_g1~~TRINITY_DN208_c0_g1_i11.p1  ORF type:complete len:195 (+),score=27.03 TRINITY_DN208_c0_g1_i11:88-672(+)